MGCRVSQQRVLWGDVETCVLIAEGSRQLNHFITMQTVHHVPLAQRHSKVPGWRCLAMRGETSGGFLVDTV